MAVKSQRPPLQMFYIRFTGPIHRMSYLRSKEYQLKILLSSVFGPFGVDDLYSQKENKMELFHNQVTREQGLFSIRFNHHSFGLYFLAENINIPATVLDFPDEQRFIREIKKGYDYIGISFITPNFSKAKRMSELVRIHAPDSEIILGGHGTRIPDIEELIDCDHVCRGEGIYWLRELLGEDTNRPVKHPLMPASFNNRIVGIPMNRAGGLIVPGVGCPNACRFCATSHFFDKAYTPYFDTGQELFDICNEYEDRMGLKEFFVMDENFLKRPQRARELLSLMEQHGKLYRFGIFSSAETIQELGVEFLARLGVNMIWIGVESKRDVFEKNRGIDLKTMIHDLQSYGISVLASGILFMEHHDKKTIWEDIDYLVDLKADLVQFMQLGPLPETQMYLDYKEEGVLDEEVPYKEWHGQYRIWFHHPAFTREESENYLRKAFQYDYDQQGSSLLRMCDTVIRGYSTLKDSEDPYMINRGKQLLRKARIYRTLFPILFRYAHTKHVKSLTEEVIGRYEALLGPARLLLRLKSFFAGLFAAREAKRVRTEQTVSQPAMMKTLYRSSVFDLATSLIRGKNVESLLSMHVDWSTRPVQIKLASKLDFKSAKTLFTRLKAHLENRKESVTFNLDMIESIEKGALQKLLNKVREYEGRVFFSESALTVREALSKLPAKLQLRYQSILL